jgi:hypothetical protein
MPFKKGVKLYATLFYLLLPYFLNKKLTLNWQIINGKLLKLIKIKNSIKRGILFMSLFNTQRDFMVGSTVFNTMLIAGGLTMLNSLQKSLKRYDSATSFSLETAIARGIVFGVVNSAISGYLAYQIEMSRRNTHVYFRGRPVDSPEHSMYTNCQSISSIVLSTCVSGTILAGTYVWSKT